MKDLVTNDQAQKQLNHVSHLEYMNASACTTFCIMRTFDTLSVLLCKYSCKYYDFHVLECFHLKLHVCLHLI